MGDKIDGILSQFITRTSADPGLARDVLEGHGWDLSTSLDAYYVMKGILPHDYNETISKSLPNEAISIKSYSSSSTAKNKSTTNFKENEPRSENNVDHSDKSVTSLNNIKFSSEPSLIKTITSLTSSPSSINSSKLKESEISDKKSVVITSPSQSVNVNYSSTLSSPTNQKTNCKSILIEDLNEDLYPKKLLRGISRATDNVNLVSKARCEFAQDFKFNSSLTTINIKRKISTDEKYNLIEAPDYTFTLPDLSIHLDDFRQFLEKDLIEKSTLVSLENAGRLNWWSDLNISQKLWPLATTGDGNCLLHAASLGMWGFHDRLLTLRKALHAILTESEYVNAFYRRWRWQTTMQNKETGLILCEDEWRKEWQALLKMASTEPRVRAHIEKNKKELSGGKKTLPEDEMEPHVYESLEEIHIIALAHVLKRPIIVIADTMLKDVTGEPFAPIPFGGIYLPFEVKPSDCHRSPLCLTYDAAHFSALVAMDKETYADKTPDLLSAIPLTDPVDNKILPIQFMYLPECEINWEKEPFPKSEKCFNETDKLNLLRQYLDIRFIPKSNNKSPSNKMSKSPLKESSKSSKTIRNNNNNNNKFLEKSLTLPSNFEFDSRSSSGTSVSGASSTVSSQTNQNSKKSFGNKAAKQFQMISKHFGSLGRSVSKRIKRSLTRRGNSFRLKDDLNKDENNAINQSGGIDDNNLNNDNDSDLTDRNSSDNKNQSNEEIIVALLNTEKRHEYHEEMIRNYLNTARIRYLNFLKEKSKNDTSKGKKTPSPSSSTSSNSSSLTSTKLSSSTTTSSSVKTDNTLKETRINLKNITNDGKLIDTLPIPVNDFSHCVNTGCNNFGSSLTNYLCTNCYNDQKKISHSFINKSVNDINKIEVPLIESKIKKFDSINNLSSVINGMESIAGS